MKTKQYGIIDDWNGLWETKDTLEEALVYYEEHKETRMESGVISDESFVSLVETIDDFETEIELKKAIAIVDYDLMKEIGTPRENGCDYDYWAKWQEVIL